MFKCNQINSEVLVNELSPALKQS